MRAIEVSGFGGPKRLRVVERATPAPGPGEVLLEVHAAGVGFADLLQREGSYVGGPRPPFVPGNEAAGVVAALGPGVEALELGQRVVAVSSGGLYATHAVVSAALCAPWPVRFGPDAAAALPVSALTALAALSLVARATPGETVWIPAAVGSLGSTALQIARCLELRPIAFASTLAKRKLAVELDADSVFAPDKLTRAPAPHVVLDSVGGEFLRVALRRLEPWGRVVVVGCSSGVSDPVQPLQLLHHTRGLLGFHLRALLERPEQVQALMRRILDWVGEGRLIPQVAQEYALEDAGEAQQSLLDRARTGKPILRIVP